MLFCLAGMNAADLYDLKKTSLKKDWTLCYNRKKTRGRSNTRSYNPGIPRFFNDIYDESVEYQDQYALCYHMLSQKKKTYS